LASVLICNNIFLFFQEPWVVDPRAWSLIGQHHGRSRRYLAQYASFGVIRVNARLFNKAQQQQLHALVAAAATTYHQPSIHPMVMHFSIPSLWSFLLTLVKYKAQAKVWPVFRNIEFSDFQWRFEGFD
jgi:hypothetical protein